MPSSGRALVRAVEGFERDGARLLVTAAVTNGALPLSALTPDRVVASCTPRNREPFRALFTTTTRAFFTTRSSGETRPRCLTELRLRDGLRAGFG
jgi:hypothetical protein